ncbi:MAG: 4Fe-4S binding protein [Thermoflexales bacterium]|nr:4Fe-4S binding protein [Thermoflexales bacterium]
METLSPATIALPVIDYDVCQACPKCAARKACRIRAIVSPEAGEAPFIDSARCYGCRACMPACPFVCLFR